MAAEEPLKSIYSSASRNHWMAFIFEENREEGLHVDYLSSNSANHRILFIYVSVSVVTLVLLTKLKNPEGDKIHPSFATFSPSPTITDDN